jgi:hypothetical protein
VTREDIYDHLAQVYLGKRKEADHRKKKQFNAWLIINIFITVLIFASASYGLTAFLTRKGTHSLKDNIIFSLSQGTIKFPYDFISAFHPDETFSLSIPKMDASRYTDLQFSIRANYDGNPGIVKVTVKNKRNETASYYVQGIGTKWKGVIIPLNEFRQITDWSSLADISFVLESWNVDEKKGSILIDDLCFSKVNDQLETKP